MSLTNEDKDWIASTIRTAIIEETRQLIKEETRRFATKEDLERVETSLLTEFHKWAGPTDQKLRSHREALRALDLQIEAIASRVEKLEAAQELKH